MDRSSFAPLADHLTTVITPAPPCPFEIDASFSLVFLDEIRSGLLRDLTPTEFMVLMALRAFANGQSGKAWPTIDRLVLETGLHRTTIMKAIGRLEEAGRIYREGRDGVKSSYWPLIHLVLRDGPRPFGIIQLWSHTQPVRKFIEQLKLEAPQAYKEACTHHAERRWRQFMAKRLYALGIAPASPVRAILVTGLNVGGQGPAELYVQSADAATDRALRDNLYRILALADQQISHRQGQLL